jgi:hypothetical protein
MHMIKINQIVYQKINVDNIISSGVKRFVLFETRDPESKSFCILRISSIPQYGRLVLLAVL